MALIPAFRSLPSYRKVLLAVLAAFGILTLVGFLAVPAILKPVLRDAIAGALHRKTTIREIRVNPFALTAAVRGLAIAERDGTGTWVSAEEIFANLEIASVIRGGPVLREIRLAKPYVNIVRHPDGSYNFTDILEEISKKPKRESKPLKYSFNNIQVIDGRVDFDDGPKGTRHKVEGIRVSVPFISNLKHAIDRYVQPSFSAVVNGDAVSLKGKTKPFQESLETSIEINIIDLAIPKYLEYVPFGRDYEVPSALLDLQAVLSFLQREDDPPVIRLDGYAGLRNVRITAKDKSPMISLPWVRAVISPADIGAREIRLASVTVKSPEIDVAIDRNGRLNLLNLIPGKEKENTVDASGGDSPSGDRETVFSIDEIRLSEGTVRFSDDSRSGPFRTELKGIRIDVDRLGNGEGQTADASLAFVTEKGESFGLEGTVSISPFASDGTVTVGGLALGKYAPFYRDAVLFDVTGGTLDLRTGYAYAQSPDGTRFRLHGLGASMRSLRLRQRDEKKDFLEIPILTVKDAAIDPGRKEIVAGGVETGAGRLSVVRGPGGMLNVSRLAPDRGSEAAAAEPLPPAAARKAPEKPWTVVLKKAAIDRYAVRFEDGGTNPPVALAFDDLRFRAENVTAGKKGKASFSFSTMYNGTGTFSLDGSFSLDPPSLSAKLRAGNLPIGPLQPYFTEKVKILVTGGGISADGSVSISVPKDGPLRAGYEGDASVAGFDSVDKAQGEGFLKFDTLHFGGIDASHRPTTVSIRDVSLTEFYSRIIVNPDGTLNVQGIVVQEPAPDNAAPQEPRGGPAPPEPHSGPPSVRIDNVTLQGGSVSFSDRFVNPNYSASLVEIGGRVSGLSSREDALADVDLRGKLERSAPLEIRGKINPLAKDLFLDLKVDFREMDLSPLTPYSGRYAGYEIRKGKLTLNLSYHIEKRKLEAQNKVFIDQFTFGEAVDSPDATKLPVRLAVSLLKDRQGEIHLDLPVAGRIDDPKFSVWGVIWKIVGNLLVKAATSPFALIGALVGGGGEELSYLEFDPGRSEIPPAGASKVSALEKALYDRPALKLEIRGSTDAENDREALRQLIFRRKLAAQKVAALVKAGQPAPALDNVRIDAAEYPKYLALAYKQEKFPKPRNFLGIAKELPAPEMEKLMMTHIKVTDGDLRQLAVDRATRVRDALAAGGKVEPGRIFLVEPRVPGGESKGKAGDSRVDFLIK